MAVVVVGERSLQWGRGHVTAEIAAYLTITGNSPCFNGAAAVYQTPKLQWGRGHVTAEIPNTSRVWGWKETLQRGRGHVTAEIVSGFHQ